MSRPRVFLDVSNGTEPIGRLVFELFTDKTPKTCENFRVICTGEKPPLTYKASPFHRIIDEFMVQGGDITKGNGTGGESIYGGEFENENIGWREIDQEGLLCMANRGPSTNSSQFFISLVECPHLNGKHTVFGTLVAGKDVLERMSKVEVDKDDRPLTDVVVSHCGELERKKRATHLGPERIESSTSRGRHKRRHTSSSRSRSASPSRGHGRRSASRHRHKHRRHRRDSTISRSRTPTPPVKDRRRSDASPDHNIRGRQRHRSRSGSPIRESSERSMTPQPRHYRRRSPPPSRPRSRSDDRRRQRSLPNQYRDWRDDERRPPERPRGDNWNRGRRDYDSRGSRGGGDSWRREDDSGRLGGSFGGGGGNEEGIVYKGRGAMKYREQKGQGGKRW